MSYKQVKVTETIERWCCETKDLKPCQLTNTKAAPVYVCIHCFQLWVEVLTTDAAGSRDTELVRVEGIR